ncbi:pre-B-cell leukemia homeobox interacting protein 1b [Stigmatopora argus]
MAAGNNANSSWTIVSPEETVAETVRPLEEEIKHEQDNDDTPTGDPSNQPAEGVESSSNLEDQQVAEKRKTDPIGDSSTDHPPSFVTDAPVPSGDNQSEAPPDGPNQDSFSVSHATPCCEPLGSLMSTETLGGVELAQQERQCKGLLEKDPGQEGEKPDLLSKHTDYAAQSGSGKEKAEGSESERKRLLDSLEKIGRVDEEEEGEEEEFQLPQQKGDDSMFSLNKCILGAVFLVGLGTVFFSGVLMDLDEESDFSPKEPRDLKEAGKQEWLHPDAENLDLLTELAKENQQISVLQAQLEAQKEELKAAEGQVAQSETERLRWLEENSRLKSKVASLPVLQKENERLMKELETLPTLEDELKTLRSTVTKLTVPPSGQPSGSKQHGTFEQDKDNKGEKKENSKSEWKESEKKESKDGSRIERERKGSGSDKHEHGPSDKVKDGEGKREGGKDSKKERRGDEGKMWKEQDGKKPHAERKEWKKDKHEKHEKQWERKEEMKWRKDEGETHKEKDKWKKNKGKDDFLESGEKNWKNKDGKGRGGERKHVENTKKQDGENDERKQWGQKGKSDKDWQKSGAISRGKVDSGELKGERSKLPKHKLSEHHHEENMWAEKKSGQQQSSADPSNYWSQQRKRLHRKPKQPQHCHSQEACAQAEGLRPVSFPQFQSILQEYLAKAEQAGVDSSKRDELQKLVAEFFQDGVFMHDRVNFRKFVKDLSDILEDMVEGEGDEEDSDLEEEMEAFGREALQKFLAAGSGGKGQKGELKKESARASG